jgi:hypothetical protein
MAKHNDLIIAEAEALRCGNVALAEKLRAQRWSGAMGLVVNSENTKRKLLPVCGAAGTLNPGHGAQQRG